MSADLPNPPITQVNDRNLIIGVIILGLIAAIVGMFGVANAQGWFLGGNGARVQNHAYFPVRRCINMGSALEADNEGDWGYRFEAGHFEKLISAGFDTVRIPIKWSAHISAQAPYTIDPVFLARVDDIVRWGNGAGLNVIINVHHFDGLYETPNANIPKLRAIWQQLAAHYRTAPPQLMFEIINEPRDNFSGDLVNQTQNSILGDIRQTNPERTVILTGDTWGGIDGMDHLRLPADPFVVATVHYYGPYEFTHQGASWLENAPPAGRSWPIGNDLTTLSDDVGRIAQWRNRIGAPVLLGEYGVDAGVPNHLRASWTADVTHALDNAQIPACYFNFAGGFSMFDAETGQFNRPILEALGLRAP